VFCVVNVALTLAIGTGVALLLRSLRPGARTALGVSLLLAWAMPALTTTVVWQWLFDTQYGLVNRLLTALGGDYEGHGWLEQPLSFFFVATIVVVWMSVPFVAFTLHAGMTQIPDEMLEAAAIDGAGPWQRFRDVIIPSLAPLYLVLAALSTLWDLKVFTQIYVLQQAGGITRETNLLGVWAYRVSIGENRYDIGAAVAIVMVAITMILTFAYVRRMLKDEAL
jgi:N,N'-diacetylchitobiose transport system permease protein